MGLILPYFRGCYLNRRLEFVQSKLLSLSLFYNTLSPADFIRYDMGKDKYHKSIVGKDVEGAVFDKKKESVRSPHRDPGKCWLA